MYLQMNKTIKPSFAKRIGFTFMMLLLTTATAWATTTSSINVGGTDYTLFTGFTATDGTAVVNDFVYGNMVDGNSSTSFHAFTSPAFVEFNTDDPIIPKGYIFNTYMGGNFYPQAWVLKAKANATDDWTELSSYSSQTLPSGQEFQYACDNDGNTAYKYFRFEASNSNNNIWLTEIRLYGFENLTYTHLTVKAATCTEVGIKKECYRRSDGKYFTDENGTSELAEADVIDPMIPHTGVHHAADEDHIEYWQCSMCNKYFSNEGCTTEITEAQTLVVRYLDGNGTLTTLNENATAVTSTTTSWSNGWFVVYDNVTIADRISVSGTVNLILCNGATLTASKGITVISNNTLNIYAQTNDEATMGALVADATSETGCAGIGGESNSHPNCGTIVINGGKITANGNEAGIGGGGYQSTNGNITINGGIVSATAGDYSNSAGIGGGNNGYVASVTLNGGIITATGDTQYGGAGIGTGAYASSGTMTITIGSGVKKLVAARGSGSDCIGKQPNASTTVNVVFKNGETTVTGDDKDAVFYDTGEGTVRQVRAKAMNHAVTMSDDLKANITVNPEYALAGETVTLTLGMAVDASTLKVNDGTSDLTLTDAGNSKYTFTMPNGNVTVTATAAQSYAVTLPANMEVVSATNAADANGKYITGTTVTFKASFPYAASDVSDGTNTLTATDGIYSVTIGTADVTITATVERNSPIDLSGATDDFTVINNDVLTGTTSHTVTIASGAGISLSGATISGGIVCEGTATITLVGTNSTTGAQYKAGIQIGGSGTTLTIRGDGSLTATGGTGGAGIGTSVVFADKTFTGGNITIESGTVTAIGTEFDHNTHQGGDGIGTGYTYATATNTIGTVTIYDGIDKVDASSIKDFASVVYMHGETNVTASKTDYFTIGEDGNRRLIVQKPVIAEIAEQAYTGSEIKPEPTVTIGSITLTKGTDYVYSYTNNTNVGTATVRATFQGDYASLGYVEKTFTILPSTVMVSVTGSGTVTCGDRSATDGTSFGVMSEKGASVVLTLAPTDGNAVRSVAYGYTNSVGTNMSGATLPISDGTATLTVPNDLKDGTGVTMTVTFAAALVGGADEASAVALTDATVTDLAGGWYKVESDITFDHTLNLLGDTHLTIADGATMTVSSATAKGIDSDYTLTIDGAGALSVTASGSYPIAVRVGSYVQTGATVTANGYIGIRCMDNFDEFNVTNDFTFSGGQLTATGSGGDGIWADNDITLSCTNATDFIQASSYSSGYGAVKIADGKALTDGTNVYSGTLTNAQETAIANQTLRKSCWTELKMALEAGQSVTLTNDVDRINSDHIEPTGTVTLDLNGYTIDGGTTQTNPLFSVNNGVSMTITDSRTGGNLCNSGTNPTVSVNGGTLTLAAGTINAQSNGVFIWGGNFNMTGGTITGGSSSGVYLYGDNATFTMNGGTITGNDVGVDVNSATAMFIVSGNVNITGNTTKDVCLYDNNGSYFNPIHISKALNEAARIGINISDAAANAITGNVVMVFTDGLKDKGTKQNFTLNGRDGLALATTESGEIALGAIYTLTLPSAATVSGYTAEQDAPVGSVAYKVPCRDVVTINYTGAVTDGKSVRFTIADGTITYLGSTDGQGKCITFTMPGSNATISKDADEQDYTFANITLKERFENGNSYGLQATLDGSSLATISIPTAISVTGVTLNRTFTPGKPATLMLPFNGNEAYGGADMNGAAIYTFTGVALNETTQKWEATMTELDKGDAYHLGALVANTPYIVVPTASSIWLANGGTLCTAEGGGQETKPSGSNWTFKGTYSYMKWTTDTSDPDYNAERADEIGKAYGFAGKEKTDIEVGDFVRVASGAKIRPMGCYLLWSDTQNAARRMTRGAADSELPQRITVRLVSSNGETTAIGELDTKTGEISMDGWWTLDGIKLSGKPSSNGIYINNGKKIVIK